MRGIAAIGVVVLFASLGAGAADAEDSTGAPDLTAARPNAHPMRAIARPRRLIALRPAPEVVVYCGFGRYTACPPLVPPPCHEWACVGQSPDNTGDYSDYF